VESLVADYLAMILSDCRPDSSGTTAGYIPELANVAPDRFGVCLSTIDGVTYGAGDTDVSFSIQSISKAFVYALAIAEHGVDSVLRSVGVEPSGEAFNEMSLERGSGRPLNPMINAGALTTHGLVGTADDSPDERFEKVRKGLSAFAGRALDVDEAVYASELSVAYRNRAIANMLRSYGVIAAEPNDLVMGYTRQCSINVTLADLAIMGATLANGGVQPVTGERVVTRDVVRQVLSVMMSCGMYDAAGDWMSTVGIPAKSGVSGGIIGVLPGQVGIATFSPRLDRHGNSVRGIRLYNRMSRDMGMHIMDGGEPARSVVRRDRVLRSPGGGTIRICSLQGAIQFSGAERVVRILVGQHDRHERIVLDLRRVSSINDVSRRMLAEAMRRLDLDGVSVTLVDPYQVMGELHSAGNPEVLQDLGHLRHLTRLD
jgi:glutaminase